MGVPFWLEVLVPLVPQVWQVLTDTPVPGMVPGTAPGTVPGTATAGTATAASWPTPTVPSSPPPATPPDSATPVWCPTPTELLCPLSPRMLWLHARSTWLPSLKKKRDAAIGGRGNVTAISSRRTIFVSGHYS